jgi:hypothetical protein
MNIGRKEIKEALNNIQFTKKEYQVYEIDYLILQYYNISKDTMLEDVTEPTNEFDNICEVYEYIDDIMQEKGYYSTDLATYILEEK